MLHMWSRCKDKRMSLNSRQKRLIKQFSKNNFSSKMNKGRLNLKEKKTKP